MPLSRLDAFFLSLAIIFGIFPYTSLSLFILLSKRFLFIIVIFVSGTPPPHRETLSCLFSKRSYWLFFWVDASDIPLSINLFMLTLILSNLYWLNSGIFGNYFSTT